MNNFELVIIFSSAHAVVNITLKGISHEDSLMAPPSGGNSINWVLGHIVFHRDKTRALLGMDENYAGKMEQYARGSAQLDPKDAMQLSELLKMYNDDHNGLIEKLKVTDLTGNEEQWKNVTTLAFHESYHTGQLGVLRRVIGKEGAIK